MSPAPASARHILTFAQTLKGGGVERAQLRLARAWIARGRRVTLVLGAAEGPLDAELPEGIEIVRIGSADFPRLLRRVPRAVRTLAPDVIFCPGNHYTSIAWWTKLRLGAACPPIVVKISNTLTRPDHSWPMTQVYRFWLRRHPAFADGVVAMTPAMAAEAVKLMRVEPGRVSVIANPPAAPIPGVAAPAMPKGRYLLGVGRLVPQKRWERLIAAMVAIADPGVSLAILGEGPERGRLEAQIAALRMRDRIMLPGYVIDPLPAIAEARALVLVSDFEGVPGVLREALALGTPVVTTESSVAAREIVSDPTLGSIVAAGDEAALVAALDHWIAPGAVRPEPVPPPGEDAGDDYLALFDALTRCRLARRA